MNIYRISNVRCVIFMSPPLCVLAMMEEIACKCSRSAACASTSFPEALSGMEGGGIKLI